jgi:hypothetical protein
LEFDLALEPKQLEQLEQLQHSRLQSLHLDTCGLAPLLTGKLAVVRLMSGGGRFTGTDPFRLL